MKTTPACKTWIAVIAGFCAAVKLAGASQLTFADTWKDTAEYDSTDQTVNVVTTGSFSTSISLSLGRVDQSRADTNTFFTLDIGPAGSPLQIIADTLGDAEKYSAVNKTATFAIIDPYSQATNGSVTVSWTATSITVTGSSTGDSLAEEQLFALASNGSATNSTFSTAVDGNYYEVSLTLDASDNGGGIFSYDEYVPVTGSNKETEYTAPNGSGPYPLESGSISGAGDFTPPTVSITAPPANSKVYDTNLVVNLTGQAGDNIRVYDVECVVNGNTNHPIPIDQLGELPTNSVAWTASVDLGNVGVVGTNVITVTATDGSGNQASVSRDFIWVATPGAPDLSIMVSGMQVVVSWPSSTSGWLLQTNSGLGAGTWGRYAGTVTDNRVTNSPARANLFFRLAQPRNP